MLPAEHLRNERVNNLCLTGLEGTHDEIKSKFIRLEAEKMNMNIQVNEMAVCKPLPPITQTSKPTAFMLMFTSTWTRRLVFDRLQQNGTDIYVSDDLNKEQATLLFHCRQLKRRDLILACWAVNNKIMIRESNDQRPIEVHSVEELERMTGLTVPAT